ncbi:MAG: hypothetical protein A2381_09615 [Bdellovibrionales bacterium RIFOXYB1_FULL_37_110]|nr:MAG: hypothetical protein A2417_02880 [Bdellovibrionales bacterium RIFOXYC1_FULL_37_79]OFZ59520.1 MAG: hypothetical protein A2381_09615 [Bdellovibrionales bacterium RIFOXYB1_FULL_37_110]
MIKQLSLSALLALYLTSFCSFAALDGQGTGNGGDVLVCKNPDSSIQSIILYDFYEAKFRHDITLDLDDNSTSLNDKVTSIINKIKRLNPTRATLYEKWWNEFQLPENTLFTSDTLSDIPDTGEVTYPANCEIVQAAHQKKPFSGERRYKIRKDLWDQMDNANKAGLVIHELIYREAKEENAYVHLNSKRVRYLNATFFSNEFNDYTIDKYLYMLAFDVQFSNGEWNSLLTKLLYATYDDNPGIPYIKNEVDFYPNGFLKEMRRVQIPPSSSVSIAGGAIILDNLSGDTPLGDLTFKFYPDGTLEKLGPASYLYAGKLSSKYENPRCTLADWINLHSNGQIKRFFFSDHCVLSNKNIRIEFKKRFVEVNFSPSGYLIGGYDIKSGEINYNNNWYTIKLIVFSKAGDGQIESICLDEDECGPFKQTLFQHENFIGNSKATSACSKKPSEYLESTKQEAIKACNDFLKEKLESADISLFSCPTSCIEEKCDGGGIFSSKKKVVCTAVTKYNSN